VAGARPPAGAGAIGDGELTGGSESEDRPRYNANDIIDTMTQQLNATAVSPRTSSRKLGGGRGLKGGLTWGGREVILALPASVAFRGHPVSGQGFFQEVAS